ncbi:MAG: 4-hydroxy-tetrahydrodipicolinate synthase [candidate division WOR-3 bacterium]|nr:4-hydroxy-tetrahydrodipicolinate synthase [candidate division WOR-3 bacterium]
MLKGCCTALITPFNDNSEIDFKQYIKQINRQIENGVSGILSCGTTGEAPALSDNELFEVIETAVKTADKRVYVIAGTGTNNTSKTIARTNKAGEIGADYALVITPYYNKPSQRGLYGHFKEVAEKTDMDIVIYNVPSRTGVNIEPDTVAALSEIDGIIGIKEASGSINQTTEILMKSSEGFRVMSGEDSITLPMMSAGASGVISTISNVVPDLMQSLFELYYSGQTMDATVLHRKLYPLARVLFIETNPIPLKFAMKHLKLDRGNVRLPLAELSECFRDKVTDVLAGYKIKGL